MYSVIKKKTQNFVDIYENRNGEMVVFRLFQMYDSFFLLGFPNLNEVSPFYQLSLVNDSPLYLIQVS